MTTLGARVDGHGVTFAVFSGVANAVDVCVFDERGDETRHPLEAGEGDVWQGHVAGAGPGTRYGFRVRAPWSPGAGARCNPAKLLLDPYARAIAGGVEWNDALVMDSLRYWVQEMHVDGFRFDLAASLGRATSDFDPFGGFLDAIGQDPVLSQVKLIAEPWDIGEYELVDFPPGWSEWNGRYRDTVRDFWRSTPGMQSQLELRRRGTDRRSRRARAARPPAPQLPRHTAALRGRAAAHRR